jgi:outer membrane protein assembly factor BamA
MGTHAQIDTLHKNDSSITIKSITVQGNKKTHIDAIKYYLQLDTGMVYDSAAVKNAKRRLLITDLFIKVDILTLYKEDGAHLYVILFEGFFVELTEAGGEMFLRKYNQDDFWWRARLSGGHKNFRGRMESIRFSVGFWDWRLLSLSWTKPFFPSNFYTIAGFGIDKHPDQASHTDFSSTYLSLTGGYSINHRTKVYTNISPSYIKVDSMQVPRKVIKSYEIINSLGFVLNHKDRNFDPRSGFQNNTEYSTNGIFKNTNQSFSQIVNDFRFYIPCVGSTRFVFRNALCFRDSPSEKFHFLSLGGLNSVRGYHPGDSLLKLDSNLLPSNYLRLSAEYRFPIFQLKPLRMPIIANFHNLFSSITYKVDGALITDYARIAPSLGDLLTPDSDKIKSGIGLGLGLRVMVLEMLKSGNIDLVWGSDPNTKGKDVHFDFRHPKIYLYVDMMN